MEHRTYDIVLAATLRVLGYKCARIELLERKGAFIFVDVPEQVILDYDLGNLLVEPLAFNNSIKALTTATRRKEEN